MRFLLVFLFSSQLILGITFEELDFIRSLSNDKNSIIQNGTDSCNKYFEKNKYLSGSRKFQNFYLCKFSKKRNRFYIYMLAVENKTNLSLKEFCTEVLMSRPEISDHMDKQLDYQNKEYLSGFYIDNFFNDKVMNFTNDTAKDDLIVNNEINNFILQNRKDFTNDNSLNNDLVSKEIDKINRIRKKIINNSESDLDKIIKSQLKEIVRYKIFVNDTKKFISYSCNWQPGKGLEPYVKREKFSEFENS